MSNVVAVRSSVSRPSNLKGTEPLIKLHRQDMREELRYMAVSLHMQRAASDQRRGINQQYDEITTRKNTNKTDLRVSGQTKAQLHLPRKLPQALVC